jgi:hypothetical protein
MLRKIISSYTENHATHKHAVSANCTDFSWVKNNSVALLRERTILTERPPLFGEVTAKLRV